MSLAANRIMAIQGQLNRAFTSLNPITLSDTCCQDAMLTSAPSPHQPSAQELTAAQCSGREHGGQTGTKKASSVAWLKCSWRCCSNGLPVGGGRHGLWLGLGPPQTLLIDLFFLLMLGESSSCSSARAGYGHGPLHAA